MAIFFEVNPLDSFSSNVLFQLIFAFAVKHLVPFDADDYDRFLKLLYIFNSLLAVVVIFCLRQFVLRGPFGKKFTYNRPVHSFFLYNVPGPSVTVTEREYDARQLKTLLREHIRESMLILCFCTIFNFSFLFLVRLATPWVKLLNHPVFKIRVLKQNNISRPFSQPYYQENNQMRQQNAQSDTNVLGPSFVEEVVD